MNLPAPLPVLQRGSRKVPMIIGCALCMELIDATVVMTALPQMARDFAVPAVQMNLVVSLYMLAAALCVPISGWAADRFGPKRLFLAAICLFIGSSLACALSTSLLQLCLARMAQGVAGAMMVPVGQVLLLRWSPREELLRNLSYLTIPALIGPILGPPLGGVMVTFLSWHWIFLVNLPIGLLGLVLVRRHVPAFPGVRGARLDGRGLLFSGIGLGALVFGFEALGHRLLPLPWVFAMLGLGALAAALYLRHARRCAQPLLDLSLLRIPSFAISFWGGNLLRLGTACGPFLLVLLFQSCFGLSPLAAGLLTLAGGAGAFLMKLLAVRVVRRYGIRRTLTVNAVLTGLSLATCALFTAQTPYWLIVLVLFGSALIRSLQFSTLGALTYADVPSALNSRASSLQAMTVQLSMSLSVGLAATLLSMLMGWRGHASLQASDVAWVLLLGGAACVASALVFRRLEGRAGQGVVR